MCGKTHDQLKRLYFGYTKFLFNTFGQYYRCLDWNKSFIRFVLYAEYIDRG